MVYYFFLFSLFLRNIIFIRAGFIPDKLFNNIALHLDRFDGQCSRNSPHQMLVQGVKTVSTKIIIGNCTLITKGGPSKKFMATITIDRCRSKENLDTCEQYFKKPNIDYCRAVDPNSFISKQNPFFIPFEPPLKCPISKGIYQAYNVTIDLTPFIFFQLDGWYWRVKFEIYSDRNTLVYCMHIEGYVTNTKSTAN